MMNDYSEEEILEVVAERVRKFTSNESTSVTYNTARQIMSSVLYCMEAAEEEQEYSKENNFTSIINIQCNRKAKETFRIGLNKKKDKISNARLLYDKLKDMFYNYENQCYFDTIISGMEGFFKVYDVEFDATNDILTLDYPLLKEVFGLKGIDLIYEYLLRTELEQQFLSRFAQKNVIEILSGYHSNHSEHIMNICKLVLRNALGCMLIQKTIYDLKINSRNRFEIQNRCEKYNAQELEHLITGLLENLIREEFDDDKILFHYLKYDIPEFAFELKYCLDNNCLKQLFLDNRKESSKATAFEDGISMEDKELRKLIEKMQDISFVEDRIELLKRSIKSLSDLKEILQECFYEEEYNKVFALLSLEEIDVLQEEINQKIDFDEELYEWEKELMKRTDSIS